MWVYPTVHVNISHELIDHSSIMDFSLLQASICPIKPAKKRQAKRHCVMTALENSWLTFDLCGGDTFLHTLAQASGRGSMDIFDSVSLMLELYTIHVNLLLLRVLYGCHCHCVCVFVLAERQ